MNLRPARPADHAAIRAVNRAAFDGEAEAVLVDALRCDGDVLVELVADDAAVIGHILFSRLQALDDTGDAAAFAALAPVAVAPERQRQGIGGALIRHGLAACADAGADAVVVLGHPDYYPRFGFSAAAAERLAAPFSGPAFMALELRPGALATPRTLRYASAFGL